MSDKNPRLKNWLDQVEQSKYQSDRQIRTSQVNNSAMYHVIQNESALSYVGFWRRVFATIIDWAIAIIPLYILTMLTLQSYFTVPLFVWFSYHTILPSTHLKGTIGKLAVGAVIVDKNGNRLSYLHSIGRFFASILSGGMLLIGYIMVASHPKKRGLHDMMANTYVVNKK